MLLDLIHEKLGWPDRGQIFQPTGDGARVYARLAHRKLGNAIVPHHLDAAGVKVGVLAANPYTSATEPPLAVVCEFRRPVSDDTLRDMHKLSWNFSRCPMLVTVEPHLLRAWTCCEPPSDRLIMDYVVKEVPLADLRDTGKRTDSISAAQVLHWVNLVSGKFFKENESRFRRDQRADQMLLENLHWVRQRLRETGLQNDDMCHDLLARIIFIQFLFDRKDSSGKAALNPTSLGLLHDQGILRRRHGTFSSILGDYEETYRLFYWLNERFNGDLFPGTGEKSQREKAWQAEKRQVKPRHLEILQEFVAGRLNMPTGQLSLWKQYAFDAIPLEFISTIYEAFVNERARPGGIYYTPPHLVDFMLDRVLPWKGADWNLKVLDPACGSGVFLVKAFQRLIHRWKEAHPREDIRADTLRRLLERNLYGVDKDPHAVRVASFSLYLAMCDEIDPKHYWTQVNFPPMRGRHLINADFFEETREGFRTRKNAGSYDLVVGNAPWGEQLLTETAKEWASHRDHKWPVANKGIGTLFLPKASALAKEDGRIAMIQSASSLLFNRSGPAREFREQFFSRFLVEEVINLSALRFKVFKKKGGSVQKTVAPACVISFRPKPATGERLLYISPKVAEANVDEFQIVIGPHDVKEIHPEDAAKDADVWTALMWGNRRDWVFIRRLRQIENLERLRDEGVAQVREGLIPSPKGQHHAGTAGRRFWEGDEFPPGTFLFLNAESVPASQGVKTHRATSLVAFDTPQLIIKQAWQEAVRRFQAALTRSKTSHGVLFTQSYVSVHVDETRAGVLEAACLSYNSILAVYFLLLTSSRFASYRPEPLVEELLRVPIPVPRAGLLDGVDGRMEALDTRVRDAFGFKDAEWVLVEDLFDITLADFKGDANSPGRQHTQRFDGEVAEPQLTEYCEYFTRVLTATFGEDKAVSAIIFHENAAPWLPFRVVAFHLDHATSPRVRLESLDSSDMLVELEQLNQTWLRGQGTKNGGIFHQRIARIYDTRDNIPTIYIIKPDARRYWTRSMGLHDADEVAADFMRWEAAGSTQRARKGGARGWSGGHAR